MYACSADSRTNYISVHLASGQLTQQTATDAAASGVSSNEI